MKARKLYYIMGCPKVQNFKHILRQNIIQNCPVTLDGMDRAKRIFGLDIGTMKGKTTRARPIPVKKEEIEVPAKLTDNNKKLSSAWILCL